MRRALLLLAAVGGLISVPLVHAALAETPVLASGRNEVTPSAGLHSSGDELLGFSRSRAR